MVSLRVWLFSVLIAAVCGYLAGLMDQDPSIDVSENAQHNDPTPDMPVRQDAVVTENTTVVIAPPQAQRGERALNDQPTGLQSAGETAAPQLSETAQALGQPREATRAHLSERRLFEAEFDPDTQDYDAQVVVSDFLQLHEHADKIDLQMLRCDASRCQLMGQFEGHAKLWSSIVDQMKDQDWWAYKGTSSTSNSRDGITYFNVFLSR